jgi:16S rRNA (guanine(527)-N(7))-methyltransferase RsmG
LAVFRELLARCASVSLEQAAALEAHYELLCRWNRTLNLTRVEKIEEAVERHYCESLFLAERLPERASVVDIGSGAGFPGFVVAVARPQCAVTLVESHQRKAVFLREASRKLENLRVKAVRAEAVAETFDWMVSRAVSYEDLSPVLPQTAPHLALLTGAEAPPRSWPYEWEVVPLPSGKHRFLHVGTRVSRETNG